MPLLFVYGTLRKGEYNHDRFEMGEPVAEAETKPLYEMIDLGRYPAIVRGGETAIKGEVYDLSEDKHRRLAQIEVGAGYWPGLITMQDGSQVLAYFYTRNDLKDAERTRWGSVKKIKSGDWRRR